MFEWVSYQASISDTRYSYQNLPERPSESAFALNSFDSSSQTLYTRNRSTATTGKTLLVVKWAKGRKQKKRNQTRLQFSPIFVTPHAVIIDQTVNRRILIRIETLHPLCDDILAIDNDVDFYLTCAVKQILRACYITVSYLENGPNFECPEPKQISKESGQMRENLLDCHYPKWRLGHQWHRIWLRDRQSTG